MQQLRISGQPKLLTYAYDPAGNRTLRQYWSPGGGGILIHTATYDPTGNRLTIQELNGDSSAYSYDPASQLTYEQRVGANAYQNTYSYDGAGNRVLMNSAGALTTYAYGPANNLLTAQSPANVVTTYTFDNAGNQTLENANGALTTYVWDGENRQKVWTPAGGTPTTFSYAADGLRRSTNSASGLTYNVWDEQNQLRTVNGSNVTQQRFTDYPGYWGGLSSLQDLVAMVTAYYGFDMPGNTRMLTAPDGTISDQYWYTSWGVELNSTGTTNNIHHFSGEVGGVRQSALLSYLRDRIVEKMIARWLSRDSIKIRSEELNLFCYVKNNPITWIDPSGQCVHFGGNCYGTDCHGDPSCPPMKPAPLPPKPPSKPKKCFDCWAFHDLEPSCESVCEDLQYGNAPQYTDMILCCSEIQSASGQSEGPGIDFFPTLPAPGTLCGSWACTQFNLFGIKNTIQCQ